MKDSTPTNKTLQEARDQFVRQWGAMGTAWGINRTMAQIHALLITSTAPLSTDDMMAELQISRGNAHGNIKDLVNWGLVHSIIKKGDRREYFEAEKDVWKMFCIISRERRRRELRPALQVLKDCAEKTRDLKSTEATEFTRQLEALSEFLELADSVLAKVAASEKSNVLPLALKLMK